MKKYPTLILFTLFIMLFSVVDLLTPYRDFSDLENRVLANAPDFSIEALVDGEFSVDYETYVNDQFVGRDSWITLKSVAEQGLGKIVNNSIVYGRDDYLFDLTLTFDEERYEKNKIFLSEFVEKFKDDNVFVSFIPNSTSVMTSNLPIGFPGVNQEAIVQDILKSGAKEMSYIDLFMPLQAKSDEAIYYKTDHHWTTLGAYYAYVALSETLGYVPQNLSDFESVAVNDFYGTYYSRVKNPFVKSEDMTYYQIPNVEMTILDQTYDSLYDESKFETYDKYSAFLRGNNGLTTIKSDANNDKKLLIIKDSYANSLVPFMTSHYETIELLDVRHANLSVEDLINQGDYDQILFLFSVSNFTTETHIAKLRY